MKSLVKTGYLWYLTAIFMYQMKYLCQWEDLNLFVVLNKAQKSYDYCCKILLNSSFQDLSGVPADWIVESSDKKASDLSCPPDLASATLDQLTVWVDPLDGTAEYTQVACTFKNSEACIPLVCEDIAVTCRDSWTMWPCWLGLQSGKRQSLEWSISPTGTIRFDLNYIGFWFHWQNSSKNQPYWNC